MLVVRLTRIKHYFHFHGLTTRADESEKILTTLGQERIQPLSFGGAISVYLVVKSHYGFTTVREIKYTSQLCYCCDKTTDSKMALRRKCCFPNCI